MNAHIENALMALASRWRAEADELNVQDAISLTHQLKLRDCADELAAVLRQLETARWSFCADICSDVGWKIYPHGFRDDDSVIIAFVPTDAVAKRVCDAHNSTIPLSIPT